MKLRLVRPAALLAALAFAAPALAAPPRVVARAFLVENSSTGEVLAGRNVDERLPIASITKLMTVLVTLEHARLDDVVTVSADATKVGGSSVGLQPGERLSVRDLIAAALIQSANDAALALADYVGEGEGSPFVSLMNQRARSLGLKGTHFVRPDGLDAAGHVSSARDVTLLARVLMRNPLVRELVRQRSATIAGGRRLSTRNDLLATFPGLIGVKTGHTAAAGWSEVAAARGQGVTVYATILGSPSRAQRNADLAALLVWGLSRYSVARVIDSDRVYATVATQYGRPAVRLVPAAPLTRVVRVDRPLVERVIVTATASLPVRRGQQLGWVRVYDRGRLVGARPLIATESIPRPGLGGRIHWYAGRTVHHVLSWLP